MILHTVNKSPARSNCLESCLRIAPHGGALMLIEDGVYASVNNTEHSQLIVDALTRMQVFVLEPDIKARGLSGLLIPGVSLVGYPGFVELTQTYDTVQSWY